MSFINMFYRTGASNKNKELERAVNERNCDEIKVLLSTGADINHTVNQNQDTMLHTVKSAGIARDLLGYSANVNARNLFEKTPLHSAVLENKNLELVRTLLEHAADVEAKDSKGNTPLNCAVKSRVKNCEVIKELIMHGADIGAKNAELRVLDNHCSPLDNAVLSNDLACVKILIKYTLLKKFYENYSKIIDLSAYYRCQNYYAMQTYFNECGVELLRMKREKLNDKTTLFQVVMSKFRETLYNDDANMKLFVETSFAIITSNNYPIYCDVITEKLRSKMEISGLKYKIRRMELFLTRIGRNSKEKIMINSDINPIIAKYLSKNDLFNLILAFYDPTKHSCVQLCSRNSLSEIKTELNKRLCEASTSSSCAKYMKLA